MPLIWEIYSDTLASLNKLNFIRNIIEEAKEELINNICNSREATLRAESQELLGRMSKKVNLLQGDKVDIQRELADNKTTINKIIQTVRELGNLVDADKLKVTNIEN